VAVTTKPATRWKTKVPIAVGSQLQVEASRAHALGTIRGATVAATQSALGFQLRTRTAGGRRPTAQQGHAWGMIRAVREAAARTARTFQHSRPVVGGMLRLALQAP